MQTFNRTTEELADYLRCSIRQVKRMREQGNGPSYYRPTPHMVLYPSDKTEAWLEAHKEGNDATGD